MTREQRAKVAALTTCHIMAATWEAQFVRSMAWVERHDPTAALSPGQRYQLDRCLWRFRRQLAGRLGLGFALPTVEPVEGDYVRAVVKEERQRELFE